MTFGELLDSVRTYYIDRFLAEVGRLREDGKTVFTEPVLRGADGHPLVEGALSLPIRSDLVVLENSQAQSSVTVDTEEMLSFEPCYFAWGGTLQVWVGPFQWNWLEVVVSGAGSSVDWTPLQDWFLNWFQPDQESKEAPSGTIHFLSDPVLSRDSAEFSIDLGTAAVESIEQLLDCLSEMKFRKATLGHLDGA